MPIKATLPDRCFFFSFYRLVDQLAPHPNAELSDVIIALEQKSAWPSHQVVRLASSEEGLASEEGIEGMAA